MQRKPYKIQSIIEAYMDMPDAKFIAMASKTASRVACHLCMFDAYPGPDGKQTAEIDRQFLYMLADELSYDVATEKVPHGVETDVQEE